ncbi:MAG TPA: LytR C-terminal domain-containing protein [Arthrobacter sp.]|nr:LytR C-terminal domain-containing protein [Arthrobacter sp.]
MSNYPRDEFDRVPESSSRQGVHREQMEQPKGKGLALVISAGVIALLIGAASYFVLPNLNLLGGSQPVATQGAASQATDEAAEAINDDENSATSAPSDESDGGTAAGASESAAAAEETEAPTSAEAEAPSESAEPSPEAAAVDKSTGVVVLNSTTVPGLAGNASSQLTASGWPVTFTGNWVGAPQPSSVVFYDGPDQLANAQAIAGSLGIDRLVNTAELQQPLTVVLGPGFG